MLTGKGAAYSDGQGGKETCFSRRTSRTATVSAAMEVPVTWAALAAALVDALPVAGALPAAGALAAAGALEAADGLVGASGFEVAVLAGVALAAVALEAAVAVLAGLALAGSAVATLVFGLTADLDDGGLEITAGRSVGIGAIAPRVIRAW